MASSGLRDSGCLGGFFVGLLWVGLLIVGIVTEEEWILAGISVSITAIFLGFFIGGQLAGKCGAPKRKHSHPK